MLRTFFQKGQAYGSVPTTITAKINNSVVYSGPVNTINTPRPQLPNSEIHPGVDLFSWTAAVDFEGSFQLEVTVAGSQLLLTATDANCVDPRDPAIRGQFYSVTDDDVVVSDPFSNEKIDSVTQTIPNRNTLTGQWYWLIPTNSTFTTDVNTQPGIFVPEWDSTLIYEQSDYVRYQAQIYRAKTSVPINTPPPNTQYWNLKS